IEAPQNGGFATPGGTDQGGDLVSGEVEADIFDGLEVAVVDVESLEPHHEVGRHRRLCRLGFSRHAVSRPVGCFGCHDHAFLAYRLRSITAPRLSSNSRSSSARLSAAARWRNSSCGYEVHWKIWIGRAVNLENGP